MDTDTLLQETVLQENRTALSEQELADRKAREVDEVVVPPAGAVRGDLRFVGGDGADALATSVKNHSARFQGKSH